MKHLSSFPKIFHVGDKYVRDIFKKEVEVTEKVDGSQIVFGKIKGELKIKSKGAILNLEDPNKMFGPGVSYIKTLEEGLPDNHVFYGEYLNKPKHNTLEYERNPNNYIALFGVETDDGFCEKHEVIADWANRLGCECVPLLFKGMVEKEEDLLKFLDTISFLGKTKIEGIVAKRYEPFLLGSQVIPLMSVKLVSEAFKEKHGSNWSKEHTGKGKWETFKDSYRTEARWNKAIQHLKESGILEDSPKDIGPLIREVMADITTEEKENIKDFLWKEFGEDLLRRAINGLPEWYKGKLFKEVFKDGESKWK